MFLNKTLLKKTIKHSFRWEGLTVGRICGGFVVAGGTWVTWTEDGYIPNWLKAAVMEFTGELPQQERVFRAKKNEPIQYEIADDTIYDLPSLFQRSRFAYAVTPVVVKGKFGEIRILQQNSTLNPLGIQEKFYEMIDLNELGEENAPAGPSSMNAEGSIMIYKNEHSAYAFCPVDGTTDVVRKVMGQIGMINFNEEDY